MLTGERLREFRHELRTPLNHILGFAEILIDDAEDAGRHELLAPLREILGAGAALLEALQSTLPGEMESLDQAGLARASAVLRPHIAYTRELVASLETSGGCQTGEESLEHLQTIATALGQMSALLARAI